jgi:hypothetical protein
MKIRAVIEDYVKRHGMTKKQLAAQARMHPQVITDLCAERIVGAYQYCYLTGITIKKRFTLLF